MINCDECPRAECDGLERCGVCGQMKACSDHGCSCEQHHRAQVSTFELMLIGSLEHSETKGAA